MHVQTITFVPIEMLKWGVTAKDIGHTAPCLLCYTRACISLSAALRKQKPYYGVFRTAASAGSVCMHSCTFLRPPNKVNKDSFKNHGNVHCTMMNSRCRMGRPFETVAVGNITNK